MYKQSSLALESDDGQYKFNIFINEHLQLLEIFSIGLVYLHDESGSVIVLRYNGDHGMHKNQLTGESFSGFHIHKLTEEALKAGIKGENYAEQTTKYASVREALRVFFTDIHTINTFDFFPELQQGELFNN